MSFANGLLPGRANGRIILSQIFWRKLTVCGWRARSVTAHGTKSECRQLFALIIVPQSVIIDSSGLVALLDPCDQHHRWSRTAVAEMPLPWLTCEAGACEAFFLLTGPEANRLTRILRDGRLQITSPFGGDVQSVLDLMDK